MDYEELWLNLTLQNLTDEEYRKLFGLEDDTKEELAGNILIIAAYLLIILVSLVGNSLVCKVSFSNRTTTNTLIASLSISDLIVTVFNIPLNVIRLLLDEWPFGHVMCFFVPFVQIMAVYVSSFTMAVIAIHRWRSVTSRLPSHSCSRTRLSITILITWLLSGVMAVPLSMFNEVQVIISYKPLTRCRNIYPESVYNISLILTIECFLTQYIIPLTMACLIYSKIAIIISRQGKVANSTTEGFESRKRSERKRRRIIMLILVVVIFAICWLCHWFAMSSVCYNPFIYCSLNSTFRNEAKKLLSFAKRLKSKPNINCQSVNRNQQSLTNVEIELNGLCTETLTEPFRMTTTNHNSPTQSYKNCCVDAIVHQNNDLE